MNNSGLVVMMVGLLAACGSEPKGESAGDGSTGTTGVDAPTGTGGPEDSTGGPDEDSTGGPVGSTGEPGSSTGDDAGDDSGTGEPPGSWLPEPPVGPFTCTGARWVFTHDQPSHVRELGLDPRQHLLVHEEHGLLDLDALGQLDVERVFDLSPWWQSSGPDGLGNWFMTTVEDNDSRRRWIHKFDVAGDPVWKVDLGLSPPENSIDVMAIAVAPNGELVLTDDAFGLHRLSADGEPLWDVKPADYLRIAAINDAGEIVGLSPGENPGVQVLNADGSLRWQFAWPQADGMYGRADINAAGEVVAGATWSGVPIKRFSAAGELLWQREYSFMPDAILLDQLAFNDAGEIAVAGHTFDPPSALVIKLDAQGEPVATHRCSEGSVLTAITIDAAGAIYAGGSINDGGLPFVAAFD